MPSVPLPLPRSLVRSSSPSRTGGSGDPKNNSKLATVITKAKAVNMPKDNIKRTIDKALASGNSDSYENLQYEGYGPSGVAVIVEVHDR